MAKTPSVLKQMSKVIEEVKATKNWKLLDAVKTVSTLDKLSVTEKESLSHLFLAKGEELLEKSEEKDDLKEAISAFEMVIRCDPSCIKAWTALAQTHLKIGLLDEDEQFVEKAIHYFDQTSEIYRNQQQKLPLEVLWDFGICLYTQAKLSEEAIDFKRSLGKYSEAFERGLYHADFLLDYGTAMGELGVLLGNEDLIRESTELLEKSLEENGENSITWLRLACAYKILYFITGEVGYFEKGDQSFFGAARLTDGHVALWLNWGQLLLLEGKTVRDSDLLKVALDKLEKADTLKPQDPLIISAWADAKMHLGVLDENYDYLRDALEKLELALEIDPNQNDIICLLGHCLTYIGKYFGDALYVEEAIEKFQMGVSRNKNSFNLWHGLANAHYTLGELTSDSKQFEKAAKFCSQTIRLGGTAPGFWNDWGVALMRLSELTHDAKHLYEAVEKFEEAINTFQRKSRGQADPDWFYNYGCALDSIGDIEGNPHYYERAIGVLSRLIEQYPSHDHARYNLALALYHLGDIVGDVELLERAVEHYNLLIISEPEEDGLLNDLGLCLLTLADFSKDPIHPDRSNEYFNRAEQTLFQAIALGSEIGNYYLACLYSLKENYTESMHFIERSYNSRLLPPVDDLMRDEWLEGLRQTPRFRAFLSSLSTED